jgi:hypothetical protein
MKLVGFRRLLAVSAVTLIVAGCTSGGPAAKNRSPTSTRRPTTTPTTVPAFPASLVANVTPQGWVPLDFGNAQVSVPANWNVSYDAVCVMPVPPGAIYIGRSGYGYCPYAAASSAVPTVIVGSVSPQSSSPATGTPERTINGIAVFGRMDSDGHGVFEVPELGVQISLWGRATLAVLATLTRSPAAVVQAAGPAPAVPKSWRWTTGGGLSFAVPTGWDWFHVDAFGPHCGKVVVLPWPRATVADLGTLSSWCPAARTVGPHPQLPVDGVVVALRPKPGWPPSTKLRGCLHLHGMTACIYERSPMMRNDEMAELDILFARVTVPGHAGHELLEIGLAGNGMTARTILYSLRPA